MEGDLNTWSHCGKSYPHAPHLHSFAMNEGRYDNVQCNGTPGRNERAEELQRRIASAMNQLHSIELNVGKIKEGRGIGQADKLIGKLRVLKRILEGDETAHASLGPVGYDPSYNYEGLLDTIVPEDAGKSGLTEEPLRGHADPDVFGRPN